MNLLPFLLATLWLSKLLHFSQSVVVDGHKRKGISATKHQSNKREMLDASNDKICGISDANLEEYEFVNMAKEGQFPWIISFQMKIPVNLKLDKNKEFKEDIKGEKKMRDKKEFLEKDLHFCCGSIIDTKWILTAAHCFDSEAIKSYFQNNKLKVVAGSHKVSSRFPMNRNLTIDKIYLHGSFIKKNPIGFDIALVELNTEVDFAQKRIKSPLNEQIKPFMNLICLPKLDKKYKFNESARIAGWGLSDQNDEFSMPSKLLTTDILINDTEKCSLDYTKEMKSDLARRQFLKYDDFICASLSNARDTCQSDSGGPLMQFADGRAVVIGIVSYGISCASKLPGLYTRTSAYINWIREIIKYGKDSNVPFRVLEAPKGGGNIEIKTTTPKPVYNSSTKCTKCPVSASTTKKTDSRDRSPNEFRFFDD